MTGEEKKALEGIVERFKKVEDEAWPKAKAKYPKTENAHLAYSEYCKICKHEFASLLKETLTLFGITI